MGEFGPTEESKAEIRQIIGDKAWKELNRAGYIVIPTALMQRIVTLLESEEDD